MAKVYSKAGKKLMEDVESMVSYHLFVELENALQEG
jgi:hypothetical protein